MNSGKIICTVCNKYIRYKNIAVLSPADNKNKNYADNFIKELNQLGIDPVSIEWYYGRPENISRQFSRLESRMVINSRGRS